MELGYETGEQCNRNGCIGIIDEYGSDHGCSCHISPPCSYCVDDRHFCPECGWEGIEEQRVTPTQKFDYKLVDKNTPAAEDKPGELYKVARYFDAVFEAWVSAPLPYSKAWNLAKELASRKPRYYVTFGVKKI